MKKILGLDLGVGSIGWGLINVTENYDPVSIEALGERRTSASIRAAVIECDKGESQSG